MPSEAATSWSSGLIPQPPLDSEKASHSVKPVGDLADHSLPSAIHQRIHHSAVAAIRYPRPERLVIGTLRLCLNPLDRNAEATT